MNNLLMFKDAKVSFSGQASVFKCDSSWPELRYG